MKLPRISPALLVGSAIVIAGLFAWVLLKPGVSPASMARVTQEKFAVWSEYEGLLEAEQQILVMSNFQGNATIIDLALDGAHVRRGDVLVRFDDSQLEREVYKLEREETIARSELESLKNAKIPFELRDLEMKIVEARTALQAENEYLESIRLLVKEELVSEPEIVQQQYKVDQIRKQLQTLEWKLGLTKTYLHPGDLRLAGAKLAAAEQDLRFARDQKKNSVILAPIEGNIVYKPIYVGGEFRLIRIGDSVFPNQPFMSLPNMKKLSVHVEVPEAELGSVLEGREAAVRLVAFPEIKLDGMVGSVGSSAQNPPGQPAWQRFFHVIIRIKSAVADLRVRPGMSVTVQILSYFNPRATLVPRTAVIWKDNQPWVGVMNDFSITHRLLKLGHADDRFYEVIAGLKPGETVILP
jgi:HlyD family secretion protein